jgi:alkane 1-monooxygenase
MMLHFGIAVFLMYPITWLSMLAGGAGLLLAPLSIVGGHLLFDNFTPRVHRSFSKLKWGDLLPYAHIPCSIVTLALLLWQAQPSADVAGLGAWLSTLLGDWVLESHRRYDIWQQAGCAYVAGLMLSTNHIVGHELVHRRSETVAMAMGRWLLALNGDAQFSISHVYGHHMNVATPADPATARRGENAYRFAVRSAFGQYLEAIDIEGARLRRNAQAFWSIHNRLLRGVAMTGAIAVVAWWASGLPGLVLLLGSMLVSKFLFELVNYIQHYGLVRVPGKRVEPRHSWDCDHRWATLTFYNLARHSHHHTKPVLPYWQLDSTDGPQEGVGMRYGYIAAMILAAIPPLWYRHTAPLLAKWDASFATDEELLILRASQGPRPHANTSKGVTP